MAYLVDTNCLLRWAQAQHVLHPLVKAAIDSLVDRGEQAYVTPRT
jgi:hypothetical protein